MKGDFTRETFRQHRHYRGVKMQQGRVQLDSDWNEQHAIDEHLDRTESRDVIGLCGAPLHDGGFRIVQSVTNAAGDVDLVLSPGRMYVDGLLCELDATPLTLVNPPSGSEIDIETLLIDGELLAAGQWLELDEAGAVVYAEVLNTVGRTLTLSVATGGFTAAASIRRVQTYRTQPHLPDPDPFDPALNYVAYLEVWQRHITEVEDDRLREPALGGVDSGPDTTTRAQTIWQVRLEQIDPGIADPECEDFGRGWLPAGAGGVAALRARAEPGAVSDDPCLVPPGAGYRRLEHQLYRIEVHQGTNSDGLPPTFKWSRDNGSVVYPVTGVPSAAPLATLGLSQLGRDVYLTIKEEDFVEVVDDVSVLTPAVHDLFRVAGVDPADREVTLNGPLSGQHAQDQAAHPLVRRWDHRPRTEITIAGDGAVEIDESGWLPLEAGVEVQFRTGSTYRAGDYWLIPARAGVAGGVLWPTDNESDNDNGPVYRPQFGIERDYCVVGLWVDGEPEDCRPRFPPLTELELYGCCRRVEVGDDLQAAIDSVIAAGGGCLCLARGTHFWPGILRIHEAHDVSVHGEPGARLILAPDQDGLGGVSIRGSRDIEFGDLFVSAEAVPWLISVGSGADGELAERVKLHGLQLFNPMPTSAEGAWAGAVLAAGSRELRIEDCAIVAAHGVVAIDSPRLRLPNLKDHASTGVQGVHRLQMINTRIRFSDAGVFAFAAYGWVIDNCRIEALGRESRGVIAEPFRDRIDALAARDNSAEQLVSAFELLLDSASDVRRGQAAIHSLLWIDSIVRESELRANTGLGILAWVRGTLEGCTIDARRAGVHLGWAHSLIVRQNRITVARGAGIAFTGSYRTHIDANTIRSRVGITNVAPGELFSEWRQAIPEIARGLAPLTSDLDQQGAEILLWWLLLEDLADLLGLRAMVEALQAVLVSRNTNFPLLLFVAILLEAVLSDEAAGEVPGGSHAPVIDLSITNNDIAGDFAVRLHEILPLGGLRVQDNRLIASQGHAVVINAGVFGRNPALLGALIGELFRLVNRSLPNLVTAIVAAADNEEDRQLLKAIGQELLVLVDRWSKGVSQMLDTDYRIAGNTARTKAVVIESNLYEVAITDNHVVQEQSASFEVMDDVLSKLRTLDEGDAVADAVVLGEPVYEQMWARSWMNGLSAQVVDEINRCIPDDTVPGDDPEIVVIGNPADRLPLGPVGEILRAVFPGPAIWAKSPGVTIRGNQVMVPSDADVESWARGGVLVKGDEPIGDMFVLVILVMALEIELSPLFWMTETSISDNEVIGGYGHGIRVAETYLPLPPFGDNVDSLAMISELHIAANSVTHVGGVGILVDEEANAVGVDIDGNNVRDASSNVMLLERRLIDVVGGIVVRNAAYVKIHANRVTGCGSPEVRALSAIAVDRAFTVSITDNHVVHGGVSRQKHTGSAAITAALVIGAVSITDNDVSTLGRMGGIQVRGVETGSDWVISSALVLNALLYLEAFGDGGVAGGATAAVEATRLGCHLRLTDNTVVQESTFSMTAGLATSVIQDLVCTSNLVRSTNMQLASGVFIGDSTDQAVIGNNLVDIMSIGHINRGTITGNRARLGLTFSGAVVVGLNSTS